MSFNLLSSETEITSSWTFDGGEVIRDINARRIDWLVANSLEKISADQSGWQILYRDHHDGRLWELTYPQSHLHGGGPPKLMWLDAADAHAKYHSQEKSMGTRSIR